MIQLLQQTGQQSNDYTGVIINGIFVLSAVFITMIINWLMNYKSYKNEYYKKLIDKRLNNYEKAENILSKMRLWYNLNGKLYHSFFYSWADYKKFSIEVMNICENNFWLDKDTLSEFLKLNGLLYILNISFKDEQDSKLVGIANYNEICKSTIAIEKSLYNDFNIIHNIKKFIKSRAEAKI